MSKEMKEAPSTPPYTEVIGRVIVNNLCYQIVEEGDGEHVYDADSTRVGLCEFRAERIYVYRDMSIRRKRRTLAHELAHAYLDAAFNYREKYTNEDVCEFVESHAFAIIEAVDSIYPL